MSETGSAADAAVDPVSDPVSDPDDTDGRPDADRVRTNPLAGLVAALLAGAVLVGAAHAGALALLIGVAVLQAALAPAWIWGTGLPGRKGGLVVAAIAAAAADVTASVWPYGRLGVLLAVLGLAMAVLFVHQLGRGAARAEVVASMSALSLLVLAEVAPAAFVQLWHEFAARPVTSSTRLITHVVGHPLAAHVIEGTAGAIAVALVAGALVDMVLPAPRFDAAVDRGLPAVVVSTGVGAAVAYLALGHQPGFDDGRAAFLGAGLGALAGLLAVSTSFVLHTAHRPVGRVGRALRPVIGGVLPMAVLAPVAFLICLSVRR